QRAPAETLAFSVLEPLQLAALFLGWPALAAVGGGRRDFVLLRESFARRAPLRGLVVQQLRVACCAAPFGDGANGDHPVIGADAHAQRIAGPNEFGRFGARAVELHLAAGYRLSGKAARFEETRGPEPPIQPDGIGGG